MQNREHATVFGAYGHASTVSGENVLTYIDLFYHYMGEYAFVTVYLYDLPHTILPYILHLTANSE